MSEIETLADAERLGESICSRCRGPNVLSWHAPSPLWNAVMRGPDRLEDKWGIICPHCFIALTGVTGVADEKYSSWCVRLDMGLVVDLATHSSDGRVWDEKSCLWVNQ